MDEGCGDRVSDHDGTGLEPFYRSHLLYSVEQRLFEDTCRQLRDFQGDTEKRQALVDETLRLAMSVTDLIDDTEEELEDISPHASGSGSMDPELDDVIGLIANNLKEDRARASAYAMFITSRRLGGPRRRPRKPLVANPFLFDDDEDDPQEVRVESPEDVQDENVGSGDEPAESTEDEQPSTEECRARIEEVNSSANEPIITDASGNLQDDDSDEDGPVRESERTLGEHDGSRSYGSRIRPPDTPGLRLPRGVRAGHPRPRPYPRRDAPSRSRDSRPGSAMPFSCHSGPLRIRDRRFQERLVPGVRHRIPVLLFPGLSPRRARSRVHQRPHDRI